MVDDLTSDEVELAKQQSKLLLVDAWTPTCVPCKELSPILEEVESIFVEQSDLRIVKINTQKHIGFATENNVFALPCVLAFFEGEPAKYVFKNSTGDTKVVDRLVGLRPLEHYEDMIRSLLGISA
ncbi:MAG: thioredoxin family protein [Candidatus Thorarchaeota archaeon]|jgi:thioredoxin-like negative regulator of GroEL